MDYIRYKGGYKYQLCKTYTVWTEIRPPRVIKTQFICLTPDGLLRIRRGYAWDGPSGPAIDTPNFMRGSLVHDAFYQLMREGYLDPEQYRRPADQLLRDICIEDGMTRIRACWVYLGVRFASGPCASPAGIKPVCTAPGRSAREA